MSRGRWRKSARRVAAATHNALELIQTGRLTEPYSAAYDVLHTDSRYTLRRYQGTLAAQKRTSAPLLLVPPLMLTAEIYDIAADLSAAAVLVREGIDVWVTDFRAPEDEDDGLSRTLDDHIMAVSDAIDRVCDITGQKVHLGGYSQGGMFAYQTAAFRRSKDIASVITFGSPVDIHRSVSSLSDALAERITSLLRVALGGPISRVEGLPGSLTSMAFKAMGMRQELRQFADFLGNLHDRQALEKREAKRIFLRGGGFVAWPGPAFRTFVDEFIVANRMATGGFVICGKTVSLAEIDCPILCFVGERDDMASPSAVRGIYAAAPEASISEVSVKAGHFGLVVGRESLSRTWPTVIEWIRYQDGVGPLPEALAPTEASSASDDSPDRAFDLDLAMDVVGKMASSTWHRVADAADQWSESVDHLRYQVPRLARLRSMQPNTQVSFARALEEQAHSIPERTFFLWRGRAFSYAVANRRVNNIVRGLIACGVLPTQRVGVLMLARPSYLSLVAAINRVGAVAVLLDPRGSDSELCNALDVAEVAVLITDPDNTQRGRTLFDADVFALGGGDDRGEVVEGVVDMEAIDPEAVKIPAWYQPNPGRARDLAMIIMSRGRALQVSNHRWAFSAYGAAAAATVTAKDTVYSCLPMHHMAGTIMSAGTALVGGARLALAREFSPESFWSDVRRYGATIVFYTGPMCRQLVDAPHRRGQRKHPIRLFAGSGMRVDVWERIVERFGPVGVLEFYASTETNAVLANASGHKVGAVGRPMPGSSFVSLARFDLQAADFVRGADGFCLPCHRDEPGMMLTQVDACEFAGINRSRLLRDVYKPGDAWYSTNHLLRKDHDGDYWFVEKAANFVRGEQGLLMCMPVEDALLGLPEVRHACAYGVHVGAAKHETLVASIVLHRALEPAAISSALSSIPASERPTYVRIVEELPLVSEGFQPDKRALRLAGVAAQGGHSVFRHKAALGRYQPL